MGVKELTTLKHMYETMLTTEIRPFLRSRGFTNSHNDFERRRAPLYDRIDLQGNWHNGTMRWHGFFVNVQTGSFDIEAACPGHPPELHSARSYLLNRRWEYFVPDAPYEVRFDHDTDMGALSAEVCRHLARLIDELDSYETTAHLVGHATGNNLLIAYENTCCYLAATDDIDALRRYVATLRQCFGHQERWTTFNRRIAAVTGKWAREVCD